MNDRESPPSSGIQDVVNQRHLHSDDFSKEHKTDQTSEQQDPQVMKADLSAIHARLDALQEQVTSGCMVHRERANGEYEATGTLTAMGGMAMHVINPRYFRNDANYKIILNNAHDDELDDDGLKRKQKYIQLLMEKELASIKREDAKFAKMMERQNEVQQENTRLRGKLAALGVDLTEANLDTDGQGPDELAKDGTAATTAASNDDPMPSLNRVQWPQFIAPELEKFSIDVLDGEPSLTFASYYRPLTARRNTVQQQNPVTTGGSRKKQIPNGQGPLPERIRINSRHIIKILQKLDSEAFEGAQEPLVMIRPYKALAYYEEHIRQVHHELVKKLQFGPIIKPPPSEPESNPSKNTGSQVGATSDKDVHAYEVNDNTGQNAETNPVEEVMKDPLTSSLAALRQLEPLIEFLDVEIKAKFDHLINNRPQKVTFHDVWYLFKPGDEVVDQSGKQAYRIFNITSSPHKVIPPWRNFESLSAKSDETPVEMRCVHIDYNGTALGPVMTAFEIPRFDGEKSVITLPVFPLRYCRTARMTPQDVRFALIARGKMFLDVLNQKHMHYSGLTLESRDEVDGQVVVDFEKAFEMDSRRQKPPKPRIRHPGRERDLEDASDEDEKTESWQPNIANLIGFECQEVKETICDAGCCATDNIHKDSYAEKKRNVDYQGSLIPVERSREPSVAIFPRRINPASPDEGLAEEDYVIMSYRVFGFVLRNRKWAKLDLTHLMYIDQRGNGPDGVQAGKRETAFDQLVLDPYHKRVLQSLVAQHYRDKQSSSMANEQVDIVRGKGKGLIILLHGAPGVGKTTTAEGVAELFEKPLFQITCGDLGTTAEDVEKALETNFALANRWGCILLLDEADVFLSKRTPYDFIRNGLVSVFLRVLEYYAGILFLTTNRIGDFDEAFTSRIHISLHYPQLSLEATREIFQLNIRLMQQRFAKKQRSLQVNETEILQKAEKYWRQHKTMRWNGRQIRNACQTALALAEFDAGGGSHEEIVHENAPVELGVEHIDVVCRAYLEFMRYLRKLYKTDQDRLAQKRGYRARELRAAEKYLSDEEVDAEPGKEDQDDDEGLPTATGETPNYHRVPELSPQFAVSAGYTPAYAQMFAPSQAGAVNLGVYGTMQPSHPQQQQFQFQQQQQTPMWPGMNPAWQQMLVQGQMPPPQGTPGPSKE
ncbi:hypothetical protein BJX64DRAFT_116311 [Aspergillus heterothallicus]